MKIVIDIPESVIDRAKGKDGLKLCDIDIKFICKQVANGIPIPEGHGDLIDRDTLNLDYEVSMADDWKTAHEIANCVKYAPTVIPVDKGRK